MATKGKASRAPKTKPTRVSVTGFIAAVTHETRRRDAKAMLALMRRVTGLPARMWGPSIVGFGSYHYRYATGHEGDAPLAAFSPRAQALVVYLGCDATDRPLLQQLGKHKMGKGCLYINQLADVDLAVLEQLVRKSFSVPRS